MRKFIELFKLKNSSNSKESKIKYDFDLLTREQRKKLLLITDLKRLKFRKGKRTRCTPKKNDIFVIEIFDNIFVYGIILNPKIVNESCSFFDGRPVFVIYDVVTVGINLNAFLEREKNILVEPFITFTAELNNGFIRVIGNYEKDINIDYGFYIEKCNFETKKPVRIEEYYTESGKRLKRKPVYSTSYRSITTNLGILEDIYMGLILNDNILNIDGVDYNYILDELAK